MTVLEKIFERKREEVAQAMSQVSLPDIKERAAAADSPRGFRNGLLNAPQPLALIAEVKKASPSRGVIRADFDAVEVAQSYERAGAHCLSILTDRDYFQGSPENLIRARAATLLPCLRKDFIDDPYQVYEARSWGADAILLIVASLSKTQIEELMALSSELGMDTLVEVHTSAEAETALAAGANLVGVNNRDLANFGTSLTVSEQILPMLKDHCLPVSESAIGSRADLDRVEAAGARAVLVGTTFCAAPEIEPKVREVMGW